MTAGLAQVMGLWGLNLERLWTSYSLAGPKPELGPVGQWASFLCLSLRPFWPHRDPTYAWHLLSWTHLWGLGSPTEGPRRDEAEEREADAPTVVRLLLASHLSPS